MGREAQRVHWPERKIKLLKIFNLGLLCIALSYMLSFIDRGRGKFCGAQSLHNLECST